MSAIETQPLRVLIVGCGNIAGGFDEGRPKNDLPYTHAGTYVRDGRFTLSACVEPNDTRREAFMRAWSVPHGFRSMDELLDSDARFDVISICSPTGSHAQHLEAALRLAPRLIFCEKPLTPSLAQTHQWVDACRQANLPMAVNYTRRWDPDVVQLNAAMQDGRWGVLRSIAGVYNKGILNNGSHMLDLLHLLVGPMRIIATGRPVQDYLDTDPSVPAWLETETGVPVQLTCAHAADYALFELQFIFSHGVLTMEEGGMAWRERHAVASDTFKGYRKLGAGERRAGAYPQAMSLAIDNLYRAVTQGDALAADGDTALAAHRLCDHILRQAV